MNSDHSDELDLGCINPNADFHCFSSLIYLEDLRSTADLSLRKLVIITSFRIESHSSGLITNHDTMHKGRRITYRVWCYLDTEASPRAASQHSAGGRELS